MLDNAPKISAKIKFCLSSKITWADEIKVNQSYAELPEFEELLSYFDQ